jgi:hypothetical protein
MTPIDRQLVAEAIARDILSDMNTKIFPPLVAHMPRSVWSSLRQIIVSTVLKHLV